MKKIVNLTAAFALLLLVGCGGKNASSDRSAPNEPAAVEEQQGPMADNDWSYEKTVTLDGNEYQISLDRSADETLPRVRDEFGQEYYDNSVALTILRNGEDFYAKTFTKDVFLDFLSEADKKGTTLQGMAFDKEDAEGLHFGAQIGVPGGEGGSAFIVTITKGGSMSITEGNMLDSVGE